MLLHQVPAATGVGDNLSLVLSELEGLTSFATQLFDNLERTLDKSAQRIADVSGRAEELRVGKLKQTVEGLREVADGKRPSLKAAPEKRLKPTKGFGFGVADVFNSTSRPAELVALRRSCAESPNFAIFEGIVPNTDTVAQKFSDPSFFFKEWSRTEQAINDLEERKLKEKRQRNKDKEKRKKGDAGSEPSSSVPTSPAVSIPQEDRQNASGAAKRPPRPTTSTSALTVAGGENLEPTRRPSRPLSTAVSSSVVAQLQPQPQIPGRPTRPERVDRPPRPHSMVAYRDVSSQSLVASAKPFSLSPSTEPTESPAAMPPPPPLPRPSRPRTTTPTAPVVVVPAATLTHVQEQRAPPPPQTLPSTVTRQSTEVLPSSQPSPLVPPPVEEKIVAPALSVLPEAKSRRPRPPAPPLAPQLSSSAPLQQQTPQEQQQQESFQNQDLPQHQPVKALEGSEVRPVKRGQAPPPPAPLTATSSERIEPVMKKTAPPPMPEPRAHQVHEEEDDHDQSQSSSVNSELANDPVLKKFVLMQKMNMPQGAIEQAMIRAQLDPALLFGANTLTPSAPIKISIPIKREATSPLEASPAPSSSGSAMMDEILRGKSLKKVESPSSEQRESVGGGSTSDLMKGILEGRSQLKKVEKPAEDAKKVPTISNLDGGGVASILARRIAIIGDKGSDTDSAGSEWDDSDDD